MAEIKKITLGGVTYDLKDATARESIETINSKLTEIGSPMHFVGKYSGSTPLKEGDTVGLNGTGTYNGKVGDVATSGTKEFIWDGTQWLELGDFGALGQLAYADTASMASYTPAGIINVTEGTVTSAVTGNVTGTAVALNQQVGVASTFKGGAISVTGNGKVEGTVTSTFTGTQGSVSVQGTPAGTVSITPSKTNVLTEVSVASQTASHNLATTAMRAEYKSTDELLEFSVGAVSGTVTPNVTLSTDDIEAMTGATASFAGTALTSTGNFKPAGTITSEFEGEDIDIKADGTVTGTIENTVTQPTFTVTQGTVTGTATGEVSGTKASFVGKAAKITVQPDN